MKGLLLKDFLVLTKQMKLFLVLIPVMAISGGGPIVSVAILVGAALPMTTIGYDEQSKWNELALMMPYTKKDIVFSKYLLGYLCMAGATLLFLVTQLFMYAFLQSSEEINFYMAFLALVIGLLMIAVNIPITLKYGTQKGRIVFILFVALSASAGAVLKELFPTVPSGMPHLIPMGAVVLALVLNVISILISLHLKHD